MWACETAREFIGSSQAFLGAGMLALADVIESLKSI